jgi:uncharacterized protein YaaN involved in tellurite resistance
MENKTNADVARSAILYYLEHYEAEKLDERESKLERRMKAMEDRLAGLHMKTAKELAMMQMRTSIDVGLIYEAVFYNFGAEAEKAFKAFHKHTINRLKWKRDDDEDKTTIGKLISDLYKRDDS